MVVYVNTQGARLVKEGRHLLVKKGEDTYHTLFTYKLKQIVLFGNIEISHRAMAQIMRYEIDTVFLTQNGRYLGRIASPESRNVFLHKRQYALLDDPAFGLRMARSIVAGKMANMATLLMRIRRSREIENAGRKAREIQQLTPLLEKAESVDSVRGYEGRASALYFDAFASGFIDNQGFTRRVRRPPTDPVNSVLSLLYTFLMNRVYAAVRVAGLDPYPGFLHAIDYGRYSLVLDLMEEFRTIIADTLTLSLFNLKILQKDDFYEEQPKEDVQAVDVQGARIMPDVSADPIGRISFNAEDSASFDIPEQRMEDSVEARRAGKYPVRLQPDAFKRVIEAFERKLTTEFYYPLAEKTLTYADALIYQAGHYRKVIEGEAILYQPVLLK
ncbi:MAG TPA: CRISPR-associated endonuclease Cas1 [Smithellaceae bacterium]|jgi:CRISPR-associated protein Cas1|nr:CRISPR-associated endonuclease Cas1 [Syntrophaceae bacterium]HPI52632.1 CRISPR-associated endonuclease Cas1 [Smithellaceae bacterium]HPY07676.1 CRISPR-associated endonuclease Cas1 [Smithellaceae bacterium]HQC11436.1 CRISPR-associated endonuclease Cas1 [Smithellaceae bacterium]